MASSEALFKRYLAVETAGGASWHPSSSRIAFVYDSPGYYQIFTTEVDEGRIIWPIRMTYEDDRCTEPFYLSDGSLVFSMDRGGNENFQIGHFTKKGTFHWITTDLDAKHRISHVDDSSLYYIANIEDKARLDIYRHSMPIEENSPELILRPTKGIMAIQVTSDDGRLALVQQTEGNAKQNLYLFDFKDMKAWPLTDTINERDTRWQAVKFLDAHHFLVITDHQADFNRLATISADGDFITYRSIENDFQMMCEATTTCKGSEDVYFATNEEGYSHVYRGQFDESRVSELTEVRLPMKGVLQSGDQRSFSKGMSLSADGSKLAVSMSNSVESSNVWILSTKTLNTWKATNSQMAGLSPNDFSSEALVRFASFDDLSVPYFRYLPKGGMPANGWPAIFIIHGGPEAQIRPEFNPVLQFFVNAGYAVITPNIRGSTGYGKRYMDLDNVEKRLDSIKDIEQLFYFVRQHEKKIDSSRVVIYGASYGGFSVLSAITEYPDLWAASIDIVGISNFITFLENTAKWRRGLRESEYGSLETDYEMLKEISPIHKVDRIQCPLFIIQGDNDERVPLSESLQIFEKVRQRNIPVELMRFPDEGHGLAKLSNRTKAYGRLLEWLEENVKSRMISQS